MEGGRGVGEKGGRCMGDRKSGGRKQHPKVAGNGKGEGKGEVAHETRWPISWCLTQFL